MELHKEADMTKGTLYIKTCESMGGFSEVDDCLINDDFVRPFKCENIGGERIEKFHENRTRLFCKIPLTSMNNIRPHKLKALQLNSELRRNRLTWKDLTRDDQTQYLLEWMDDSEEQIDLLEKGLSGFIEAEEERRRQASIELRKMRSKDAGYQQKKIEHMTPVEREEYKKRQTFAFKRWYAKRHKEEIIKIKEEINQEMRDKYYLKRYGFKEKEAKRRHLAVGSGGYYKYLTQKEKEEHLDNFRKKMREHGFKGY